MWRLPGIQESMCILLGHKQAAQAVTEFFLAEIDGIVDRSMYGNRKVINDSL